MASSKLLIASVLGLGALSGPGCGNAPGPRELDPSLPFTAKLIVVKVPEAAGEASTPNAPVAPALFPLDKLELERALADAIDRSGTFLRVVTSDETRVPVDLVIEVAITGGDFGPGRVKASGAIFSTLAWLFTGHLSWFIDDRCYPDSHMNIDTVIRQPETQDARVARNTSPIFEYRLPLKGLELSFLERADPARWFVNIILPPWWGEGDPEAVGHSLAKRSVELFTREEPEQISSRLPALYFRANSSFLVYVKERHELVIISGSGLNEANIRSFRSSASSQRYLRIDELALIEVQGEAKREQLHTRISGRAVGIGADNRFYPIPLKPGERGVVQVTVVLDGGKLGGPWTIYVPPS